MINLKQLRTNKKVSQKEVADYIGVSRTAYNQYESGKRDMSTDTLINRLFQCFHRYHPWKK